VSAVIQCRHCGEVGHDDTSPRSGPMCDTLAEIFAAEERGEDPAAPKRPRTPAGTFAAAGPEPRSVAFVVRCSPTERERWKRAAHERGESLAGTVRRLLETEARDGA